MCVYSSKNISSWNSPANAELTIASLLVLSTIAVLGVSVGSIPVEIAPNEPYEQLPFVALITPPFSAR